MHCIPNPYTWWRLAMLPNAWGQFNTHYMRYGRFSGWRAAHWPAYPRCAAPLLAQKIPLHSGMSPYRGEVTNLGDARPRDSIGVVPASGWFDRIRVTNDNL